MKIRRFRTGDRKAVIALLRECYHDWYGVASDSYWEWRHERNPHGRSLIWLAIDGDDVAGCYILSPVRLRIGDETVLGAQSVDAAVSPDYRRRGLFQALARDATVEAGDEGIALTFAFPSRSAIRGQVQVGFEVQFAIRKAYRPLGPRFGRRHEPDGSVVHAISRFDSGFDSLCDRTGSRADCEIARDPEYLNWRYVAHPVRRYETLVCQQADRQVGYCVLSVMPRGRLLTLGYVVDFQVEPGDSAAAIQLVSASLDRLRSLGAWVAGCWVPPDGPAKRALGSSGFSERWELLRRRVARAAFVQPFISYANDPAVRPESWSLMPGDADYM